MERIVQMSPAFDKRNPDPQKNYGIHGVSLRMVLKGTQGAVQFLLYTDWHLPHVQRELEAKGRDCKPSPADLGYHSLTPRHDGQKSMGPCEYLDGKPCYYDGSTLNAERIFDVLLKEGDKGVWRELEEYYVQTFGALDCSPTIEDGFGGTWSAYCPECKRKSMTIVRPGKVQCGHCG